VTAKAEPAPKRAEQAAERREAILDATVRIIASKGLGAVTHRAVAREARVPLAATTYYFTSKEEILREALEALARQEVARLAELAATVGEVIRTPADIANALDVALLGEGVNGERTWLAQFEIYLESARNPSLRPAVEQWRAAFVDLAATALRAAGGPDPERRAPLAVAGINGILLDRLRGIGADPEREMRTRLRELFELLLA
jgi:DNA-binding transcriptional regulator YbjK